MVVRFTRKEKLENKCVTKFFYLIILFHEEEDRRFSLTLFVDYKTGNPIDIERHVWKGMDENAKICITGN